MKAIIKRALPAGVLRWVQYRRMVRGLAGMTISRLDRIYEDISSSIGSEYRQAMALVGQAYTVDPVVRISASKYTNLDYWIRVNIARAIRLGLHESCGKRILDLGCGTGQFLAVCRYFGHEVWGIDLPFDTMTSEEREVYETSCRILRFQGRVIRARITPKLDIEGLADVGRFDLVTAFMVRFYKRTDGYWTCDDWHRFAGAITSKLTEDGFCHLEFNAEPADFPETLYHDLAVTRYLSSIGDFRESLLRIHKHGTTLPSN